MDSVTLERVIEIVARHSGVATSKLSADSAVGQDIGISGDDIDELAKILATEFGDHVWQWPWQRFVELSEPSALTAFWFVWRLFTWPLRGRLFDPSPFERLELVHVAAVLDNGTWFEP